MDKQNYLETTDRSFMQMIRSTMERLQNKDLRKGLNLVEMGLIGAISAYVLYKAITAGINQWAKYQVNNFSSAMALAETEVRSLSARTPGFGTASYMDRLRLEKAIPADYYSESGGTYTYTAPICAALEITGANSGANFTISCTDVAQDRCIHLITKQVFSDTTTFTVGGTNVDITNADNSARCSATQGDNDFLWTVS